MTSGNEKKKELKFLFDVGGVVIIWPNNDPIFKYIAKKYDVPFSKLRAVMNSSLADLESSKITCDQFVANSLKFFGKNIRAEDSAAALIAVPFEQGAKTRKGVVNLIHALKNLGYEVDGFSNTNKIHQAIIRKRGWATPLFDNFFSSCCLEDTKPNVSAYRKVLRKIRAAPRDVVFVDNTRRNIVGAKRAGIFRSIIYHSQDALRKEIRGILCNCVRSRSVLPRSKRKTNRKNQ
jgi:HAD superfamily hydrolase (TIGR01509 family)